MERYTRGRLLGKVQGCLVACGAVDEALDAVCAAAKAAEEALASVPPGPGRDGLVRMAAALSERLVGGGS